MVVARCPFSSSPTREMNPGLGSRSSRSGLSSAWFCAVIYAGIQMSHTRITEHPWRLRLFESWSKEASQSSPAVQTGSGPVCQARVKFKFMPVRADRSRLYGASASTQTGLPDARRGRPLPRALSLFSAGSSKPQEKPPQIPAIPTRYPRTPRSSPPFAVRRKRETPQQRVSYASGEPLRARPWKMMAG
jgi:hypothetical protein